jgi:ABC-type nitrate/sulfonate/bicarbonate transport system ATPase subunit
VDLSRKAKVTSVVRLLVKDQLRNNRKTVAITLLFFLLIPLAKLLEPVCIRLLQRPEISTFVLLAVGDWMYAFSLALGTAQRDVLVAEIKKGLVSIFSKNVARTNVVNISKIESTYGSNHTQMLTRLSELFANSLYLVREVISLAAYLVALAIFFGLFYQAVMMVSIVSQFFLQKRLQGRIVDFGEQHTQRESKFHQALDELSNNLSVLQSMGKAGEQAERVVRSAGTISEHYKKNVLSRAITRTLGKVLIQAPTICFLLVWASWKDGFAYPDLIVLANLLLFSVLLTTASIEWTTNFQERVGDLLHLWNLLFSIPARSEGSHEVGDVEGLAVRIEAVRYPDKSRVGGFRYLFDSNWVQLVVKPGQNVIFVGESGCGKSTLLKIMARRFENVAGIEACWRGGLYIRTNGVWYPVPETSLNSYNRAVIYCHQEPEIVLGNVADNIGLGLPDWLPEATRMGLIRKAATIVKLDGRLDSDPKKMSGGERSRTQIARCLALVLFATLEGRRVIFFADEAFSQLDQETAVDLYLKSLEVVQDNRGSMVMVTHNLQLIPLDMGATVYRFAPNGAGIER